MDLRETLEAVSRPAPLDERFEAAVSKVRTFCSEEIGHVIPSIQLGSDGPYIHSVFLITVTYIIEIHLTNPGQLFDMVKLRSVRNYVVDTNERVVKIADDKEIRYETASIRLFHVATGTFRSELTYVGENREEWLQIVRTSLHPDLVMVT